MTCTYPPEMIPVPYHPNWHPNPCTVARVRNLLSGGLELVGELVLFSVGDVKALKTLELAWSTRLNGCFPMDVSKDSSQHGSPRVSVFREVGLLDDEPCASPPNFNSLIKPPRHRTRRHREPTFERIDEEDQSDNSTKDDYEQAYHSMS